VPSPRACRTALVLLGALVAGLPLLTHAGGVGAVRWAGVSLVWWYAALAAPLAAAAITALALGRR